MTREQSLFDFWNGFDIPAFEENSVPTGDDAPAFPYITYQLVTDALGNEVPISASVWDRNKNEYSALANVQNKVEEIREKISRGGIMLPFDGGAIWLKRGRPFDQTMGDADDDQVVRAYLNMTAEFLSAD